MAVSEAAEPRLRKGDAYASDMNRPEIPDDKSGEARKFTRRELVGQKNLPPGNITGMSES
ncbi:hypothetical protein [Kitasatospora sp. NPDC057223]|uniref:hypothetical protein n=1 Tax=Kitasatospora sp. NPDC057223 TaxID=3346055 RepID=UPI00362BE9CB